MEEIDDEESAEDSQEEEGGSQDESQESQDEQVRSLGELLIFSSSLCIAVPGGAGEPQARR